MTRRVVITGGASGIGLTIAKRYLDEGARVAICDNDSELVKTVSKNYEVAISFCADVSDSNQMANFHQHIMDEFGGVDIGNIIQWVLKVQHIHIGQHHLLLSKLSQSHLSHYCLATLLSYLSQNCKPF